MLKVDFIDTSSSCAEKTKVIKKKLCKPVTCLAYSAERNLLLSGSEDGMIRVWDVKTKNILRMFRHSKGPVNNILVVRLPYLLSRAEPKVQASSRRNEFSLHPPLEKYANSSDEDMDNRAIITLPDTIDLPSYLSSQLINDHIKQLQQQGSSAAAEMEVKRLKLDGQRSMEMFQQLKKVYDNLQEFCVNELLDGQAIEGSKGK
ncbi:hypothetical protein V6N12_019322 [Hibiscus sabdariffa]|uniref:Uncharacterized protein n=1 Tax=Hibiscus sabdariffa TaxID=183260 RepID=A0ABR1ZW12_9ROSI